MEKQSKGINVSVECEECKGKFIVGKLGSVSVQSNEYNCDGQLIRLTYYDCPHCQRRHYVQVDDDTSKQMLQKVTQQFVALSVAKKSGRNIPQKHLNRFKSSRQQLADYRTELMKKVSGKRVVNCTTLETVEQLRFSVACLKN